MSSPSAVPAQPLTESDDRLWGSLAHFGNILGFLPALLIFLILKDRGPVVRRESRSALNWIITVAVAVVALEVVSAIVAGVAGALPSGAAIALGLLSALIGLVVLAVVVVNLIFSILNGVRVNQGGASKYPFSLNLIK